MRGSIAANVLRPKENTSQQADENTISHSKSVWYGPPRRHNVSGEQSVALLRTWMWSLYDNANAPFAGADSRSSGEKAICCPGTQRQHAQHPRSGERNILA